MYTIWKLNFIDELCSVGTIRRMISQSWLAYRKESIKVEFNIRETSVNLLIVMIYTIGRFSYHHILGIKVYAGEGVGVGCGWELDVSLLMITEAE